MAQEIERKFRVLDTACLSEAVRVYHIEQAYLSTEPTVRLRLRDDEAFMTIKGASQDQGLSRTEWEYPLPFEDARAMMSLAVGCRLVKKRYLIPYEGHTWEVDVFEGDYKGLVLAEIELSSTDEFFVRPPWLGEELTGRPEYYNAAMALASPVV